MTFLLIFVEKTFCEMQRRHKDAEKSMIMWMDRKNNISAIIDLNKELVTHPAATFYGRVAGDSMEDAGVVKGDVLVIDKALDVRDGDLAVCFLDGEFILRRIMHTDGGLRLLPAKSEYPVVEITDGSDFVLWGAVTYIIKKVR